MPLLTVPIYEHNDCHSPETGQFCSRGGSIGTLTNVKVQPVGDRLWRVTADQGWVELSTAKHYLGPHLSVFNIAVPEGARGKGYGQALYLAAAKAAKEIGKTSWPRYRGIFSSPDLRQPAASRAWAGVKRKYPKRVKTVRSRRTTYEVLE